MTAPDDYAARAAARIMRLLDEHGALVHPELEARIAEGSHPRSPENIDPHHITTALGQLYSAGRIIWDNSSARGGQLISTIQPADRTGRGTAIDRAAGRKRLLFARYTGWAQASQRHPRGIIGPAGEAAVRTALTESGQLRPVRPGFGEVRRLLGVDLNGPLDSAGFLVPLDKDERPQRTITTPIEVKNIRSWIYPQSDELFQLLAKSAQLQTRHPDEPILPVLICRRAHWTAFRMAKQLGFMIIDTGRQFAGDVDTDALLEVRNELHFQDLYAGTGPTDRVRERFQATLPRVGVSFTAAWRTTCSHPDLVTAMIELRRARQPEDRETLMRDLRTAARRRGAEGGW